MSVGLIRRTDGFNIPFTHNNGREWNISVEDGGIYECNMDFAGHGRSSYDGMEAFLDVSTMRIQKINGAFLFSISYTYGDIPEYVLNRRDRMEQKNDKVIVKPDDFLCKYCKLDPSFDEIRIEIETSDNSMVPQTEIHGTIFNRMSFLGMRISGRDIFDRYVSNLLNPLGVPHLIGDIRCKIDDMNLSEDFIGSLRDVMDKIKLYDGLYVNKITIIENIDLDNKVYMSLIKLKLTEVAVVWDEIKFDADVLGDLNKYSRKITRVFCSI